MEEQQPGYNSTKTPARCTPARAHRACRLAGSTAAPRPARGQTGCRQTSTRPKEPAPAGAASGGAGRVDRVLGRADWSYARRLVKGGSPSVDPTRQPTWQLTPTALAAHLAPCYFCWVGLVRKQPQPCSPRGGGAGKGESTAVICTPRGLGCVVAGPGLSVEGSGLRAQGITAARKPSMLSTTQHSSLPRGSGPGTQGSGARQQVWAFIIQKMAAAPSRKGR
eukprot:362328-Chlamydomonas_euryale.AAC.1